MTDQQVLEEIVCERAVENQHQASSEVSLPSRRHRYAYKLCSSLALKTSTQVFFGGNSKLCRVSQCSEQKNQRQALTVNNKQRKWRFLKVSVVLPQWSALRLVYLGSHPIGVHRQSRKTPFRTATLLTPAKILASSSHWRNTYKQWHTVIELVVEIILSASVEKCTQGSPSSYETN